MSFPPPSPPPSPSGLIPVYWPIEKRGACEWELGGQWDRMQGLISGNQLLCCYHPRLPRGKIVPSLPCALLTPFPTQHWPDHSTPCPASCSGSGESPGSSPRHRPPCRLPPCPFPSPFPCHALLLSSDSLPSSHGDFARALPVAQNIPHPMLFTFSHLT